MKKIFMVLLILRIIGIAKAGVIISQKAGEGDFIVKKGEILNDTLLRAFKLAKEKEEIVYLKAGNYILKTPFLFPSKSRLIGEGRGKTVIKLKFGGYISKIGYALISNENWNEKEWAKDIQIEKIEIFCDSKWPEWEKGSRMIVFHHVNGLTIRNCYFHHSRNGGVLHIWLCKNVVIENTETAYCLGKGGDACFKFGKVDNGKIINCSAHHYAPLAFNISGSKNVILENCYGYKSFSGCWIEGGGERKHCSVKVLNCRFENNRNEGVGIIDGEKVEIIGCSFKNNGIQVFFPEENVLIKKNRLVKGSIAIRGGENVKVNNNFVEEGNVRIFGKEIEVKNNEITDGIIEIFPKGIVYGKEIKTSNISILNNRIISEKKDVIKVKGEIPNLKIEDNQILKASTISNKRNEKIK